MVFANSGNTLNKRKNGPLEQIVSSTIYVAINNQATAFVFALVLFVSAQIGLPHTATRARLRSPLLAATGYNLFALDVPVSLFEFVRELRRCYSLQILSCFRAQTVVRPFRLVQNLLRTKPVQNQHIHFVGNLLSFNIVPFLSKVSQTLYDFTQPRPITRKLAFCTNG